LAHLLLLLPLLHQFALVRDRVAEEANPSAAVDRWVPPLCHPPSSPHPRPACPTCKASTRTLRPGTDTRRRPRADLGITKHPSRVHFLMCVILLCPCSLICFSFLSSMVPGVYTWLVECADEHGERRATMKVKGSPQLAFRISFDWIHHFS
jgi:hypothetical protein